MSNVTVTKPQSFINMKFVPCSST